MPNINATVRGERVEAPKNISVVCELLKNMCRSEVSGKKELVKKRQRSKMPR